jgi:hypothetical protein
MNRWRWAMVLLLGAAMFGSEVFGAEGSEFIRLRYNYWIPNYTGRVKVKDKDVLGITNLNIGTTLDLERDLDLENPQYISEAEVQIRLGRSNRIILSYFSADYRGHSTLDASVPFAGIVFKANTNLGTEFGFDRFKIIHAWSPLISERGNLSLRWGAEQYWWRLSYNGYDSVTGLHLHDEKYLPIPVPVIGIDGELVIVDGLAFYGSAEGMGLGWQDFQTSFFDLEGGLRWEYKFLHLGIGYRSISVYVRAHSPADLELNVKQAGWLGTLGVQF